MFIRKKPNKSGSVSIQVIKKENRRNVLVTTIGSASNQVEIEKLLTKAREFIDQQHRQLSLSISDASIDQWFDKAFAQLGQLRFVGGDLVLGRLYDEIGFDMLGSPIFKDLVMARLLNPSSKLKTLRYLEEIKGSQYSIKTVYRYMDRLEAKQKQLVEQISYRHTVDQVLKGNPSVVFYDVTTIYFEAEKEDELRIAGFSKEGKHKHPQILLGLLVSTGGYPMAYEIFEGNKYEGHTMMPVLDKFKQRFDLKRLVVVADSGLINSENVTQLQKSGYEFIIGARIKNETTQIKDQIIGLSFDDGKPKQIVKEGNLKLVVSYSEKRAKKDRINREKGIERLNKRIKSGRLTKSHVNNRGYNKFLKMSGDIEVQLDEEKVIAEEKWDGLKGYLTNLNRDFNELIDEYNHLWQIEKAFRISKTELRIRPIYHRLPKRIKAHICISFTAYKIFKELERKLEEAESEITIYRALEIIPQITAITLTHPNRKDQ
ncbi:MAG: IS1634 family transposase, partial [Cyclobacteriaceae bacterium]